MCGIVGIAANRAVGDAENAIVRAMASAMIHRGPDDEGFYSHDSVVMGMRRLSIIDLEGGHQPISNEDGTIWVVCNGEIYNFRQLRTMLESLGHTFSCNSDVEVIVHLYEEYGRAFVDHLSGMFGIALWDSNQERLMLVRDRMGMKPLYFATGQDGRLSWASEIKSLLAVPGIDVELDFDALREHLTLGYAVAPRTIFKGIHKLPPATVLTWQAGRIETRRYWSIPTESRDDLTTDMWVEKIRESLKEAVFSHTVSDVPVGAFLSGGIDSSAVVALMGKQSGQPVKTYSIGYKGDRTAAYYNELPWAAQVARKFETDHHEIAVEPDAARLLPKLMWHLEEPISDSAITTTYLVSQLASQSVKVILSGVGGDELFAGYNRYLGNHYGRLYKRVPGWMRSRILRPIVSSLPSGRQSRLMDLSRYAKNFVQAADMPWREQYKQYIQILNDSVLSDLMQSSFDSPDGYDEVMSGEQSSDPILRLFRIDWQTQLSEDLLLLTDKMTMAESIECRVPFLDHELVEAAASIPASEKLPGKNLKYLLKLALEPELPREILYRRKRGFGAPVGAWFKGQLKGVRDQLLDTRCVTDRGWLSSDAVRKICSDHDSSREDYTDLILVLMNLEIWARLFLDGQSHEDIGEELVANIPVTT